MPNQIAPSGGLPRWLSLVTDPSSLDQSNNAPDQQQQTNSSAQPSPDNGPDQQQQASGNAGSVFKFTSPDGKVYKMTGPNGSTPEQAWGQLQNYLSAQQPQAPVDETSDIKQGVEKGLAQVPGAVAGIPDDLAAGALWGANKLGFSRPADAPPAQLATSSAVNDATGANSLPDPQSGLGKAAQVATGVVANPLSYMGPGGALRSLLSTGAGVGAGIGATKLASAVGADPDTANAIGVGASMLAPALGGGGVQNAIDSGGAMAAASQGYDRVRNSGALSHSGMLGNWADQQAAQLDQRGLTNDPALAPGTHGILSRMSGLPQQGVTTDLSKVMAYKQALTNIAQAREQKGPGVFGPTQDAAAASTVLNDFPNIMQNSVIPGTGSMPTPELMAELQQANQNWSLGRLAQSVENAQQKGTNAANVVNSGTNQGNAIAQQINRRFGLPEQQTQFTPGEQGIINSITHPGWGQQLLRAQANRLAAGGGLGSTMIHAASKGLGLGLGGPWGFVGGGVVGHMLTGLGSLLRSKYNNNVSQAADALAASVLMRSPAGQSAGMRNTDPALQMLLAKRAMNAYLSGQQQ